MFIPFNLPNLNLNLTYYCLFGRKEKLYWLDYCSLFENPIMLCAVSPWTAERTISPEVEQKAENPWTSTSEFVQSVVENYNVVVLKSDGATDSLGIILEE